MQGKTEVALESIEVADEKVSWHTYTEDGFRLTRSTDVFVQ